jgi:hypothetical protein
MPYDRFRKLTGNYDVVVVGAGIGRLTLPPSGASRRFRAGRRSALRCRWQCHDLQAPRLRVRHRRTTGQWSGRRAAARSRRQVRATRAMDGDFARWCFRFQLAVPAGVERYRAAGRFLPAQRAGIDRYLKLIAQVTRLMHRGPTRDGSCSRCRARSAVRWRTLRSAFLDTCTRTRCCAR